VLAITAGDRGSGAAGLTLSDIPRPHAAENDVIVRVCAAGFTPGELDWPGTWTDRAGHGRTSPVPGHDLSGVVTELGYGTTGLTVGQRVFGLAAAGALQEGISLARAVDRAWMLTGVELYFAATAGCGWSDAEYTDWLTGLLHEQLLARRPLIRDHRGSAGGPVLACSRGAFGGEAGLLPGAGREA